MSYYAVAHGFKRGVFDNRKDLKKSIVNFPQSEYEIFETRDEAELFVKEREMGEPKMDVDQNLTAYYAVARGRQPGIYSSWDEAKKQTGGYHMSLHKKHSTYDGAVAYIKKYNAGEETYGFNEDEHEHDTTWDDSSVVGQAGSQSGTSVNGSQHTSAGGDGDLPPREEVDPPNKEKSEPTSNTTTCSVELVLTSPDGKPVKFEHVLPPRSAGHDREEPSHTDKDTSEEPDEKKAKRDSGDGDAKTTKLTDEEAEAAFCGFITRITEEVKNAAETKRAADSTEKCIVC